MNKIVIAGSMLVLACSSLFATPATEAYKKLHGNLNDKQVQETVKKNEFLPLFINEAESFKYTVSKERIYVNVKNAIKENKNYAAYYNGAVVAYTISEATDISRGLSDTDMANTILWATKALELSKGKQAPDMYLLRALARIERIGLHAAQTMNHDVKEVVRHHMEDAQEIVKDLEKVYEINPAVGTNFANDLAELHKALGNKQKADKYTKIAEQEAKLRQQEEEQAQRAGQTQVVNELSGATQNKLSVNDPSRRHHPFEGADGMIWPRK